MKILFFHLMPYRGLPEHFEEDYKSVWVDIPNRLWDPQRAQGDYLDYLNQLLFAEEVGFDGICVNEHHSNGYAMMSTPQMMATVLARSSKRSAILILGSSIALYDPPQRVAEDMATIDVMSGGRLIAGFPIGTPFDTCFAFGQNPSSVRQKYLEAWEIIMRSWKYREMFSYNGEYYQQPFINPFIQPIQRPHPPIWIPGGGAIETWRWAAEQNYNYSYTSYFGYDDGKLQCDGFWKVAQEVGRDRNPYRLGVMQFAGIADSRAEAIKLYREPAEQFYNENLKVDPRWSNPPGYLTEATLRYKLQSSAQKMAMRSHAATLAGRISMEELVARKAMVVGSPDEVAAELRQAIVNMNAGQLMMLLQFGKMSDDLARYNIERFAREVKPQLEDLWKDEWENHWWPKNAEVPPAARRPALAIGA